VSPFCVSTRSITVPLLLVVEYMLTVVPLESDEFVPPVLPSPLLLPAVAALLFVDETDDIVVGGEDGLFTLNGGWDSKKVIYGGA
jgi:hypothetical protein